MSVINRNTFDALKNATGREFTAELIDTFLEDMPVQLAQLKQSITAQDAESFRRAAHTIKSNAATFGAVHLAELARALEMQGRKNDFSAGNNLQSLEEALDQAMNELKGLR